MLKVLITGSEGFIGRHFKNYFLQAGDSVTGVDIVPMLTPRFYFDFYHEDIRTWMAKHTEKYDLIIHCAALVGGRAKIDGDPLAIATNLSIDSEFFRWCLNTGQENVVYFSSSAAYPIAMQTNKGIFHGLKLSEDDIDLGGSPIGLPDQTYGWAKLTGELLAQEARKQGMNVYSFRPFSGYGGDQSVDYPFPSFLYRCLNHEDPFVIWGNGEQTRDFIHVDDIVAAVMRAIELDIQQPINLGTGIAISFKQLAWMMFEHLNWHPKIKYLLDKPVGVQYRVADTSLLNSFFTPQITLAKGIQEAFDLWDLA